MIANLNGAYVALLLWSVPAYISWVWWLHQIDQDREAQVKWGLVLLLTVASVFWFFVMPLVYYVRPRKKPTLSFIEANKLERQ